MHDHFKYNVHIEYHIAIRNVAEREGFSVFGRENNGLSVVHCGAQNMCPKPTKTFQIIKYLYKYYYD